MQTDDLTGRTAVVTGSAGEIGRAIAIDLARAGVTVFATDILDSVEDTARLIRAEGLQATALKADLRRTDDITQIFARATIELGTIDILVNVAGVLQNVTTLDCTAAIWDLTSDVNYKAVFFCSQAAAKIMIPKRSGKIVNVASTSAFVSSRVPNVAYDSSKGAVRQLTVSMAHELAPFNIQVNAIAPGTIATDMNAARLAVPSQREETLARIPLGRIGTSADVVGPVRFLCSSAADYVVGHTLVVDGGWLT